MAGFALGALLDRGGQASDVEAQVPQGFYQAVRARLAEVSAAGDKRAALATLIQQVRPVATTYERLPRAARALLEPAKRQSRSAGSPVASAQDMLALLKRLAARLDEPER